ncbi:MFS transporter [Methanocella arvoryzae]|uniref:Permease (Major facilitator superfamily) n=1 Tax=Methanocella arvoryzae (strain DSM 22066 / NBRC 105507 / MRE50) TaxID=351160 RepID=Q0W7H6_METAR|nr:MFS transporter [Methanocella arvoryzae]CAJ35667.1 permease (major facilitator superfamily) [Methanocella arvoryzae MRE50]
MLSFNRNVKLFLAQVFIMGIYTGIYGIVFNLHILELGFKTDFLGLMLSVSLLAASIASVPAGFLCDRFDHKKILVGSTFLSALAVLPLFISSSPPVLLVASALGGMLGSISTVCATPFLTENCERDEAVHVFSASAALGWAASVVGAALGGLVPMIWPLLHLQANRYQLTLIASVVLLFAGCAMLLFLKGGKCTRRHTTKPFSITKVRPSPETLKFAAISVIIGLGSGMVVPYFNVYFTKIIRASIFETGVIFAVANIFMVAGFIFIPYLAEKIGRARSAVITQAASLPFLILMAITTNLMAASAAYIMRMMLMNMAGPATTSLQMEVIHPEERGFAVGLISTGNSLAVAASTYVSGLLMVGGNYVLPFTITCIAYLAAAGLLYYFFGHRERRQNPGSTTA